jgi:transketolase
MLKDYVNKGDKQTRRGFGAGLVELGENNPDIVALAADLAGSVRMGDFMDKFPDRFFQCGVAEANMMGVAAGLATGGKIPFTGTFANFSTGRVFDQIRQSIAYSNKNVKICASHQGLTLGEDGASHQILEDLGLMRMLPNMTVLNPCDYNQTRQATLAIAEVTGPIYMRFGRPKVPNFTPEDAPFNIGEALLLNEGADVTIFATGHLVWEAIKAARILEKKGLQPEVINIHTIKPLDVDAIVTSAQKTGCVVTAEEHQRFGGLGDAIAHCLSRHCPVPIEMVGMHDMFGESGKPDELLAKYKMDAPSIVKATKSVLEKKKSGKHIVSPQGDVQPPTEVT